MAGSVKSSTQDEMRLQAYRQQLERQNQAELDDIELRHKHGVSNAIAAAANEIGQIPKDYEVQIPREAESLDEKLHRVQLESQDRVQVEQLTGDAEVANVQKANAERLTEYKKKGEMQIDSLRKQFQATDESMHEHSRKAGRKQMEVAKT